MNWSKFTSRKFWLAITEFVSMLIVALGGTESEAARIAALIMAGAGVVAYIIGEGLVDAASAGAPVNLKIKEEEDDEYPFGAPVNLEIEDEEDDEYPFEESEDDDQQE